MTLGEPREEALRGTGRRRQRRRRRTRPSAALRDLGGGGRVALFALGAGLPLYLAFNGGGYEIVFRQQFGVALWWGMALALAFAVVPRVAPGPAMRLALGALAALVAWTTLSLLWTESAERTSAELVRTFTLGGLVVLPAVGLRRADWRAAGAGVCSAIVLLPVVAVASRLAPDAFNTGFITEPDRLVYPLEYWNAVASWSAMATAAALALSCNLRAVELRAMSLGLVPVAGLATYLTYSRGGVAATLIGVAVVIGLARHRWTAAAHALVAAVATAGVILVVRNHPEIANATGGSGGAVVALALIGASACCALAASGISRTPLDRLRVPARVGRSAGAVALVAVMVASIAFAPGIAASAREQFTSAGYPASDGDPAARLSSLEGGRDEVWASAIRAFTSDPVMGIGPGTFELWWTRDAAGTEALRDAHSLYLETLAELGIPGLLFLLALLFCLIAAALAGVFEARRSGGGALAVALTAAFIVFAAQAGVDWLWESTAVSAVALLAVGCVGAATSKPLRTSRLGWRRSAAVVIAVAIGAAHIPGAVAIERQRASSAALAVGRPGDAARLADDAVAAQPWAATPYAARSFARLTQGRLGRARAEALAAIEREPTNWRHRVLLATVLARGGDLSRARAALEHARTLNPSLRLKPADLVEPARRRGP